MPLSISDFEREFSEAKAELDTIHAKVLELTAQEAELAKVVAGWQAIIASKRKQSGQTTASPSIEGQEIGEIQFPGDRDEGENRTQFVRDQLAAKATTGVTVEELKAAAAAAGIKHAISWPYGAIARLKAKDQVVKRKGRFYPAGSLLT